MLLFTFLSVVTLFGCRGPTAPLAGADVVEALSLGGDEAFERPVEPYTFTFPADHGAHPQFKTEWWYYTGNLESDEGKSFGYQLTFFRSSLTPETEERASDLATNQVYMAHFAITDVDAQQHVSFERFARGDNQLAGAKTDPQFEVWLDGWSVRETEPYVQALRAVVDQEGSPYALELTLRENQMLLHGDRGLSQKGPEEGNANYYYSLVRMDSTGTLTVDGQVYSVRGLSWMDHEFGTSELSGEITGWDWFSVTLDDGTTLMFGEFHNARGERSMATDANAVFEGTIGFADGTQNSLGADSFELTVLEEWTSPTTQITYPAKWQVIFPQYDLDLIIEPLVPDQEMDVSFIYYEGATTVVGTFAGTPVSGHGYVELTGYTGSSQFQR